MALAAFSQSTRLEAFRTLVRHEPDGLAAGDLARLLEVPQNTLSAHLSVLSRAGLVTSERHSRSIIYRANLERFSEGRTFPPAGLLRWTAGNLRAHHRKPATLLPSETKGAIPCLTATTFFSSAPATLPARSLPRRSSTSPARENSAPIALGASPRDKAFREAYRLLNQRIGIFTALPLRSLDQLTLQGKLREIGHMEGATPHPGT